MRSRSGAAFGGHTVTAGVLAKTKGGSILILSGWLVRWTTSGCHLAGGVGSNARTPLQSPRHGSCGRGERTVVSPPSMLGRRATRRPRRRQISRPHRSTDRRRPRRTHQSDTTSQRTSTMPRRCRRPATACSARVEAPPSRRLRFSTFRPAHRSIRDRTCRCRMASHPYRQTFLAHPRARQTRRHDVARGRTRRGGQR